MKAFLIGMIVVVCLMISSVVIGISSYVSYYNIGVIYQANIERFEDNANIVLSSTTMKVMNAAKIPAMYAADLKAIIEAEMKSRYGGGSGGQMMLWVKERELNFDSSIYKELQTIIVAGQNEFKLAQSQKIDACAEYKIQSNQLWSGFWLSLTNKQMSSDIVKTCLPILDDTTNEAVSTKKQKVMEF